MAELIERGKITYMWQQFEDGKFSDGVTLQSIIRRMPTVDAVEVVRCKDCKHFGHNLENDTYCRCVSGLSDPEENDFCSYGERKDND